MDVPDFSLPSLRFIARGDGRQVSMSKVPAPPTASDDPARSGFVDQVLARIQARSA